MLSPLTRMLQSTFYQLQKDYGTTIQFTKVRKGEIDLDTGNVVSGNQTFPIPAILTPVGHMTEFLTKLLGREEKLESVYLIRVSDLPYTIEVNDYFVHGNRKFTNIEFEDYDGVLLALVGKATT